MGKCVLWRGPEQLTVKGPMLALGSQDDGGGANREVTEWNKPAELTVSADDDFSGGSSLWRSDVDFITGFVDCVDSESLEFDSASSPSSSSSTTSSSMWLLCIYTTTTMTLLLLLLLKWWYRDGVDNTAEILWYDTVD